MWDAGTGGLLKSEIEFEIVKPRDFGVDSGTAEFGGEVFVVLAEPIDVGCVVEGDDEGVVADPNVALQPREELFGKMRGVPIAHRRTQALAQLMESRLGDQAQAHMAVADIQV